MPCAMSSPHSVTLKHKLYIGGGGTISDDPHTIYEYRPREDQWLKLEWYPYRWFAMAILHDKLTLVGGRTSSWPSVVVNRIAVWGTKGVSQQWTDPYPRMPTHRALPAVATYNQWLVVAGGWNDFNELATVELLNTDSQQWLSTTPLPVKCCNMTSNIIEDNLYLVGGTLSKQVLIAHLPTITMQTPDITKSSAQWQPLPPAPLEWSAGITLHGSLLAIGGNDGTDSSTAIYIYQPDTKEWSKVGNLPTGRSHCSSTLLPSGEILVAGGFNSSGYPSSRVDAAIIG